MKSVSFWLLIAALVVVLAGLMVRGGRTMAVAAETRKEPIPAPAVDEQNKPHSETAVFAGGCFWGVQSVFQRVKGVTATTAGYSGGTKETANYRDVSSEHTQHADWVKSLFDPAKVSYGTLLRIFFSVVHDPTQLNRQGPDVGTSYRSAIFYDNDEQKRIAESYISQLNHAKIFRRKIVTQVVALNAFYPAEDYHQDCATRHPDQPYIVFNDAPKVAHLRQQFPDLYQGN